MGRRKLAEKCENKCCCFGCCFCLITGTKMPLCSRKSFKPFKGLPFLCYPAPSILFSSRTQPEHIFTRTLSFSSSSKMPKEMNPSEADGSAGAKSQCSPVECLPVGLGELKLLINGESFDWSLVLGSTP